MEAKLAVSGKKRPKCTLRALYRGCRRARETEASCWGLALSACLAALQTRPGSAAWWLRGGPSSGAGWGVVNSAKLAKPSEQWAGSRALPFADGC